MKISFLSLAILALATQINASGTRLTQAQAEAKLRSNGITASSSKRCTNRKQLGCTSYEGILSGTVDGIIAFKKAAGLSKLTITGGIEVGHAKGAKSHANGFKVDVKHQPKLDAYVKSRFKRMPRRGDGFPQWKGSGGSVFCDEGSHWDITFV